ncbi:MAG: hypothetical protein K2M46_04400 [Lachnospiraceae bacterium]|nr:hypothetical protein [Lachnospiraceae bacterium]
MKNKMDDLLKQALTPTDEPSYWLNQKILNQIKENEHMKIKTGKRTLVAALTLVCVLGIGSLTTYAAWKFLTPDNVASKLDYGRVAEAFQSPDAVKVNETQSYGGYDITLLGIVSGKGLSKYISDGQIMDNRTYCVTAIAKQDGTPMPETSDDAYGEQPFLVSPLIQGYNPIWYNIFTMNGGYSDIVEDGVLYRLAECDTVELFADKEIYLCVLDDAFYNADAYVYDETTGRISRNTSYNGINALFSLPLDPAKADAAAAEEYMKNLDSEEEIQEEIHEETEVDKWFNNLTPDNINEFAIPLETTAQTQTPDKDGMCTFTYELESSSGESIINVDSLFPDGKPGMSKIMSGSGGDTLEDLLVETYTLNEDGTVTFMIYIPK